MILIKNVRNLVGQTIQWEVESSQERIIDASGLTLFPALIDPHVHFRTPGLEHKENWKCAAEAAIYGGITTVFDMPNTLPPCITEERLKQKKQIIDQQLKECGIPLHYHLYLGADKFHFDQVYKCRSEVIGLKVFMGASTGDLVMDDDSSLHAAFSLAKAHNLVLAVHAEDEEKIQERKKLFKDRTDPKVHSEIRNCEVAVIAVQKAIELAKIYGTRLYLLHLSTKKELELVRAAKKEGISVYAETTPHHLFLNEEAYSSLGGKAVVNPPLRTKADNEAVWEAIHDGTIDTIGSDHAPHTLEEKQLPYGKCPSGLPGVQTALPLLLNAFHQKKISLEKIIDLMKTNIEKLFHLPPCNDLVLVDLNLKKTIEDKAMKTKCGWTPYVGQTLTGWPVITILKGQIYELK